MFLLAGLSPRVRCARSSTVEPAEPCTQAHTHFQARGLFTICSQAARVLVCAKGASVRASLETLPSLFLRRQPRVVLWRCSPSAVLIHCAQLQHWRKSLSNLLTPCRHIHRKDSAEGYTCGPLPLPVVTCRSATVAPAAAGSGVLASEPADAAGVPVALVSPAGSWLRSAGEGSFVAGRPSTVPPQDMRLGPCGVGILLTKPSGLGRAAAHGWPAAGMPMACSSAVPACFSAVRACMRARTV